MMRCRTGCPFHAWASESRGDRRRPRYARLRCRACCGFRPLGCRARLRRQGSLLLEAALAMALLLAALAVVAHLLLLAGHQRREADHRALATREAANVMERVVARRWDEIVPEGVRELALSDEARQQLPQPDLEVRVSEDSAELRQKRIDVLVRWQNAAGLPAQPVELAAWVFTEREAE